MIFIDGSGIAKTPQRHWKKYDTRIMPPPSMRNRFQALARV